MTHQNVAIIFFSVSWVCQKMLYSIGPSPARPSGGGSLFVVLPELPLLSVAEMRPGMLRPAR